MFDEEELLPLVVTQVVYVVQTSWDPGSLEEDNETIRAHATTLEAAHAVAEAHVAELVEEGIEAPEWAPWTTNRDDRGADGFAWHFVSRYAQKSPVHLRQWIFAQPVYSAHKAG